LSVNARNFQSKRVYEKVGEATETALVVLVEKLNVYETKKTGAYCSVCRAFVS